MTAPWAIMLTWPARRWLVALAAAAGFVLVVAIPTDLVDTPVFGREVPPTWWAWPSLLVSSLLGGLLVATYVRAPDQPDRPSSRRGGWAGDCSPTSPSAAPSATSSSCSRSGAPVP